MIKKIFIAILLTATISIANATDTVPVTLENYKVAESDLAFGGVIKLGGANKLVHFPVTAFDLGVALLRRPLLTVSVSLYCFILAKVPYLITFR